MQGMAQQEQELQTLTEKMGAVAVYLQQCAQQAADGVAHSQQQLRQTAQGFDAQTRQISHAAIDEIGRQARQAIAQGVEQASDECNARLKSTGDAANQAIYHLNQQVQALQQAQQKLMWKMMLVVTVGVVLATTGLGTYSWYLSRKMQTAYPPAVDNALRAGRLVPCGELLCAQVGKKPRRAGTNGEYLVLEP